MRVPGKKYRLINPTLTSPSRQFQQGFLPLALQPIPRQPFYQPRAFPAGANGAGMAHPSSGRCCNSSNETFCPKWWAFSKPHTHRIHFAKNCRYSPYHARGNLSG